MGKIKIAAESFKYHLFLKKTIKIKIKQKKKLIVPVNSSGYTTIFAEENRRHMIKNETKGCVHLGTRKILTTWKSIYPKKILIVVVAASSIFVRENEGDIVSTSHNDNISYRD